MDARGRLILLAAAALAVSCKSKPPPPKTGDAGPTDHLAPGEAAEGREKAYGLALPQASSIRTRFDRTIGVVSPLSPDELASFVRARVKDGRVVAGVGSTRFEDVVVPSDPQRRLTIDVRPTHLVDGLRSEMTVRDVTPPPVEPNLSEADRWKKAGLTPEGRPLDPKHLE